MELIRASLMAVAGGGGGGANLQHNPTFTSNGEKHPSAGYDGFDYVTVDVTIPPQPVIGAETFTANGTYTAGQSPYQSVDAWGVVTVDVGYQAPPHMNLDGITVTEDWDIGDPDTPNYVLRFTKKQISPTLVGYVEQLVDTSTGQAVDEFRSVDVPAAEISTWRWRGFKITNYATGAWATYVQSPNGYLVTTTGASTLLKNIFTGENGYTFVART